MSETELKPIECKNCGYTVTPSPLNVDKCGLVCCPICGHHCLIEYDFVDETSKEKQIEEMARDVARSISWCNEEIPTVDCLGTAATLYAKGYRKQSENTVEVVRCKDCVYFKRSVSTLFPHASAFVCDCPYGLQKNVNENDFCCHGAKMKGGEE